MPPDKLRLMNWTSQVRRENQISGLAFGWLRPFLQPAKKSQYPILEFDHAPATLSFRIFEAPCSYPPSRVFETLTVPRSSSKSVQVSARYSLGRMPVVSASANKASY